jgi:hypothetical protein
VTCYDPGMAFDIKNWLPTKKWWAAAVTGVSTLILSVIDSGEFGETEEKALGVLVLALLGAYAKRNSPTPGGLPAG